MPIKTKTTLKRGCRRGCLVKERTKMRCLTSLYHNEILVLGKSNKRQLVKNKGKMGNPDKGPAMKEGMHHFDKGYVSDNEHFDPYAANDHERGNSYMKLQNEIVHKDDRKMARDKFTKIA